MPPPSERPIGSQDLEEEAIGMETKEQQRPYLCDDVDDDNDDDDGDASDNDHEAKMGKDYYYRYPPTTRLIDYNPLSIREPRSLTSW